MKTKGWHKFPNGLIIQWGNLLSTATIIDLKYIIAFPTECSALITQGWNSAAGHTNRNKIGATIMTNAAGVDWFAIGY